MKIKSLEIENFKLFDKKFDKIKNISETDLILLNGPNGYGKTTIFDALEFALTGEIKRINTYNEDLGVAKTEKYGRKILVTDPSKEAYVMLTLEEADCELKLGRFYESSSSSTEKKPSTDNNPHKIFEKFTRKLFVNGEEIFQEIEQAAILKKYHLDNIVEFFDKCCFLSQDEHLQFLKETKKDKSMALDFMFQLPVEQREELDRVNKKILSLKNANTKKDLGYITKLEISKKELSKEIEKLEKGAEQNNTGQDTGAGVYYQHLFPEKEIKWDKKEPLLTDDEFDDANREINNLIYYAQHQEACIDYIWNRPIQGLIKPFRGGENISYEGNALEYTYRYFPLLHKIEFLETKYHKQQQLEQLKKSLEMRDIQMINWEVVSNEKLLDENSIGHVKEEIDQVEKLEKMQDTVAEVITGIIETRTVLQQRAGEAMKQGIIEDKECPYCGAPYDMSKVLDKKILAEEQKLLSLSEGTTKEIQNRIDEIYKKYLNNVAAIVQNQLQDSVSEKIFKKCQELKKYKGNLDEINEVLKGLNIRLPEEYQEDITEITRGYEGLVNNIKQNLKKIPKEVEEQLTAKDFYRDYDKYYDKDSNKFYEKTISMLHAKQEYVKRLFYDSNRKKIFEKKEELARVEKRCTKLQEIYDELSKYKEAIEEGIKDYKRSVIHDIEPLLHVYTAKILQQKFCGKSIFILTDEEMQNFQLVHSTEDNHDILYNMSSGQLAAVSLSFLLCMHQVYAKQQSLPILLIDDPIQTIDDVNMVGLVDILRFEFENSQVFISTHEQKFEWYLKYKYEKAEKRIESYNMKHLVLQTDD